jgi:hypothetical protein
VSIFSAAARAAFMASMGDVATFGDDSFKVDFSGPFEMVRGGDSFGTEEPTALANPEDIALLGITAGDYGSEIEVMGNTYLVTAIEPDESGFVVLRLGKP